MKMRIQVCVYQDDVTGETNLTYLDTFTDKWSQISVEGIHGLEDGPPQPYKLMAERYIARNGVTSALVNLVDEFSDYVNEVDDQRIRLLDQLSVHANALRHDELLSLVENLAQQTAGDAA